MSTGLGMSLDDAIQKRRQTGGGEGKRFSRGGGPGKFGNKRMFRKRFGDRDRGDRGDGGDRADRPFFKNDRPFRRERSPARGSRGAGRRFGDDKPGRFTNRFIKRTGPRRESEARETRGDEGAGRSVEGAKIKISNLDFNITHKDIMELFSKLGTVKKNKIIYDELGRSRGKAFVEFEKIENAAAAIKEYNGAVLDGKTITVEYDDERAGRRGVLRKPISRDNFQRRDDFRREDRFRDREDRFRDREDRFGGDRDKAEGDWRRDKRDDRDADRPFRRGGFRGGFRGRSRGFRGGFRKNRY